MAGTEVQGCVATAKYILELNSKQKLKHRVPGGNKETWEPKQYLMEKKSNSSGSQVS